MFIRAFNAVTTALVTAPLLGPQLGRRLTMIRLRRASFRADLQPSGGLLAQG
jgi:hypothetical protein